MDDILQNDSIVLSLNLSGEIEESAETASGSRRRETKGGIKGCMGSQRGKEPSPNN